MNRNLFSWLLYDAANSFLAVSIGGLFLAQWLILDLGYQDIWYSITFSLATILALLTSPFFGTWSDKIGKRLPFVKWMTLVLVIVSFVLAIIAPLGISVKLKVILVLTLTVLIQYFYQVSLIFYNALLSNISSDKNRGFISGLGEASNNIGWIVAAGIFLMFSGKMITVFGEPGRAQVFIPAFLLFAIFSLPILFWFEENKIGSTSKTRFTLEGVYSKTVRGVKDLFRDNKNVAIYLIAFSLISDVILTVQLYFAVAMDRLYGVSDLTKYIISVVLILGAILADYFLGKLCDVVGSKRVMIISCLVLIIALGFAFLLSLPPALYLIAIFMGFGWGGFYTASRSLMIKISPKERLGEYFGFFTTFYRFASIVGPMLWGIVVFVFGYLGDIKYRLAGFSLVLIMLIGVFLLSFVRDEAYR